MTEKAYQRVLDYWFGPGPVDDRLMKQRSKLWFGKSGVVDNEIRERFQGDVERLVAGEYSDWQENPEGRLASIILIDQFCRQIYRDTPEAFEYDPLALDWCLNGIDVGHDLELPRPKRSFFYLPLEHSEDLSHQELSVKKFQSLLDDAPQEFKSAYNNTLDYAVRHRDIIDRFGRYPHRNNILGRESTAREVEFLKQPGSSF